ncbi:hypothetical protein BJ165DRAFT_1351564 [Panaeolus papilionaceus]|nr:hypothetical protein BJ165DRAFT_1351564 [Panaeolus papilionaceus]
MVVDKYSVFIGGCDIYLIAIVMCPDRKLKWFKDHGWTVAQIRDIKKLVIDTWKAKYKPSQVSSGVDSDTPAAAAADRRRLFEVFEDEATDSVDTYLKDPLVPSQAIKEAGGYIAYWHNASGTRPHLARMATDYCSAPGEKFRF